MEAPKSIFIHKSDLKSINELGTDNSQAIYIFSSIQSSQFKETWVEFVLKDDKEGVE